MVQKRKDTVDVYTEELFNKIGLLCSRYKFEDIIPNDSFKEHISKFDNDAARIMLLSPDYFVMPGSLSGSREKRIDIFKKQTFFVKILTKNEISEKEYKIYEKYFKKENVLIININFNDETIFIRKLSEIRKKVKDKIIKLQVPKRDVYEFLEKLKTNLSKKEIRTTIEDYKKSLFK